jgi:hypothetical protein
MSHQSKAKVTSCSAYVRIADQQTVLDRYDGTWHSRLPRFLSTMQQHTVAHERLPHAMARGVSGRRSREQIDVVRV